MWEEVTPLESLKMSSTASEAGVAETPKMEPQVVTGTGVKIGVGLGLTVGVGVPVGLVVGQELGVLVAVEVGTVGVGSMEGV
jgi:hypothetical protein